MSSFPPQLRETENIEPERPKLPLPAKIMAGCLLVGFVAFSLYIVSSFEEPDPRVAKRAALELEKEPSGDDDHQTLRFSNDEPPKRLPELREVSAEDLRDSQETRMVIGVTHGDEAHAYVIRGTPRKDALVIAAKIDGKPIVITHNYLLDGVTRVFTSDATDELIDVHFGGYEESQRLVLLYNGVRYHQLSERIPLQDFPFEVTSLTEWAAAHPQTLVNDDEEKSDDSYYWPPSA